MLGQAILRQIPHDIDDDQALAAAILAEIEKTGIDILPWTAQAVRFRQRLAFLATVDSTGAWPDMSDAALAQSALSWLGPALPGIRRHSDILALPLATLLQNQLDWSQRQRLDKLAPTQTLLANGYRTAVHYDDPNGPYIAVRLQKLLGTLQHPFVAEGRVPLSVRVLSPAARVIQVTSDVPGFWRQSYADVRKDMRGRYPKHAWPENPTSAG